MIFCSLLMLAGYIFSKLFTTTKDPKKHWDTCAVVSISIESSLAVVSVRSLCVCTICVLATLVTVFITFVNILVKIVIRRLIQLLYKENDDWTVELSRLHDRSTVHRKLTQLQIITQIENFRLNEGESKEKRAANPESTPK